VIGPFWLGFIFGAVAALFGCASLLMALVAFGMHRQKFPREDRTR
jgi:hypothetical protein